MSLFCRLLELGINSQNIIVVTAERNFRLALRLLNGEESLQTRNGVGVALQDIGAY